ncbi:MAG: hypothetical protein WC679_00040 [Bacteroidales bacterium]|jgi:hypothetical protein
MGTPLLRQFEPVVLTKDNIPGWSDLLGGAGTAAAGTAAPAATSFGVHRLEVWAINDSKTFKFHIPHEYSPNTVLYPHVHWRALTVAPVPTHVVQFNLSYQIARGYSRSAFSSDVVISLVDSPTGYNYNEIIEASLVQAIPATLVETDGLIMITLTRVLPSTGTSYTGNVVVDFIDLHFQDDGLSTTTKNYPFTKVIT